MFVNEVQVTCSHREASLDVTRAEWNENGTEGRQNVDNRTEERVGCLHLQAIIFLHCWCTLLCS